MSCPTITTIQPTECIGNSLNTINNNYQALKTGVCDNQDQINALRTLLYDLSAQPKGTVLQTVSDFNNVRQTVTPVKNIPLDNTIPQIDEGYEFLKITITPKFINSKILINCAPLCRDSTSYQTQGRTVTALFRSDRNDALTARLYASYNWTTTLVYIDEPNTIASVTYSLRIGGESGTIVTNDDYTSRYFSTAYNSTLVVQEIKA